MMYTFLVPTYSLIYYYFFYWALIKSNLCSLVIHLTMVCIYMDTGNFLNIMPWQQQQGLIRPYFSLICNDIIFIKQFIFGIHK